MDQLRNVGFWNLLLDEYSLEAYQLMRDAGGYESIVGNWSAAEAIPFLLADFDPALQYFAFDKGFQTIPVELGVRAEGEGAKIYRQYRLHRLDLDSSVVQLIFDTDPTTFRTRQIRQAATKIVRVTLSTRSSAAVVCDRNSGTETWNCLAGGRQTGGAGAVTLDEFYFEV